MNFDVNKHTIFSTVVGSQSYGLSTPESDIDVKGVGIPPIEYKFGFSNSFYQKDKWGDEGIAISEANPFTMVLRHDPPKDRVIYDLAKFAKLAADCNPNTIETLFTDERFHIYTTPIFNMLLTIRDSFISQKAFHSFQGYALSQLSRINVAKKWLDNPPSHAPQRVEFGLSNDRKVLDSTTNGAFNKIFSEMLEVSGMHHEKKEFIDQFMDRESTNFVDWLAMVQKLSDRKPQYLEPLVNDLAEALELKPELLKVINREKLYMAAHKDWVNYNTWKSNRNEKRAELESKFGYDTKHAMHLCRLLKMGGEILTGKGVNVFRKDDGEFLKEIRAGMFSFDELMSWTEIYRADMKEALKTTTIPKLPDTRLIDATVVEMYKEFYKI